MADVVELPWLCVGRMPAAIWKKIAGGRAGPGHGAASRPIIIGGSPIVGCDDRRSEALAGECLALEVRECSSSRR